MYFCVSAVLFVLFVTCNTQEETTIPPTTEVIPEMSTLICDTCECADSTVDCSDLALTRSFDYHDWEGLKPLAPAVADLSNNHLVLITRFPELPIKLLNLSSCDIEEIEQMAFRNLEQLETLDLSRNNLITSSLSRRMFEGKLKTGPDGVPIIQNGSPPPFPKMRFLSLAYNGIHSLPSDIFFNMILLTTLDLSGNPLAYIDQVTMAAITDLTRLQDLRLSSCELETLPEGLLRRQIRLERLDLSDNRFTTIPSVLTESANLLYMNMNKNPISSLEQGNSLSSLTKLQELRLCRLSKLQSIGSGALGGLVKLDTLRLCHNPRLTTLDPGALMWEDDQEIQRYPTLKQLYLNNNNLSDINSHLLLRWDTLTDVDFTNNPYVCDCNTQWMVDVLVPMIKGTAANDSDANMFCSKPQELRGMSFALLRQSGKTLSCPDAENVSLLPTHDMAIMLGVMIGIFVTFPIVLILVLLWRNGYFAKCRSKMVREKDYDEEEGENL